MIGFTPLFVYAFIGEGDKSFGFFLAIALHHAVKLPAVTLIKRGVVSNKVKGADSACVHICAHKVQQRPGNALAADVRLRVNGTNVWGKVFPVMEVVFNHTHTAKNALRRHGEVPLRNRARF